MEQSTYDDIMLVKCSNTMS